MWFHHLMNINKHSLDLKIWNTSKHVLNILIPNCYTTGAFIIIFIFVFHSISFKSFVSASNWIVFQMISIKINSIRPCDRWRQSEGLRLVTHKGWCHSQIEKIRRMIEFSWPNKVWFFVLHIFGRTWNRGWVCITHTHFHINGFNITESHRICNRVRGVIS